MRQPTEIRLNCEADPQAEVKLRCDFTPAVNADGSFTSRNLTQFYPHPCLNL